MTRYAFPVSLKGLLQCFSAVECQKSSLCKPDGKSEKKLTFEPKLTSAEAYCWFFLGFLILCIQAVFTTQEFSHMGHDQFVRTNRDR